MKTEEFFIRGTHPTETSTRYAPLKEITNPKVDAKGNTATLTWSYTEPTVLTDEYIKNYFNQPVFGNSKDNFITSRKNERRFRCLYV